MKLDEDLYKAFLEEVHALESFRLRFAAMHPGVPLDREDPDIRRLIEAMALFSARSRLAGVRNIDTNRHRIFRQFFPFFLSPLPSLSIMQIIPTRQLAEPVNLPCESKIALSAESGETALFRTLNDLRVLPIFPAGFSTLLLPDKGYRFCLTYKAAFARSEEIGSLNLFINYLKNYESSLHVFYNIKKHLRNISVVYDQKADETTQGAACHATFGVDDGTDGYEFSHPLEKERLFFHFPWQELFVNVQVAKSEKNWSQFTLCLDFDATWPRNLILNQDVFCLFAVPIINHLQAMAQPVVCEGTKERYLLRHPDGEAGFSLHSIKGVYQATKAGMVPIKHCIFSKEGPTYEIDESKDEQGRQNHYLNINYPDAFFEPATIVTDAFWLQPWFSEALSQRLSVVPFNRNLTGTGWELSVLPVAHQDTPFLNDLDGLLHLLTLTNKATLTRDDLLDILRALGVYASPLFESFCTLLASVEVDQVPISGNGSSRQLKHRYWLGFEEYDASKEPSLEVFLTHVERILNDWISNAEIEVKRGSADREVNGVPRKG